MRDDVGDREKAGSPLIGWRRRSLESKQDEGVVLHHLAFWSG